jgi:signal peptidase I
MRDKLTDLRAAMDNTVFKGQKFSDESKRNLRKRLEKKPTRAYWIPNILTLAIAVGFLGFSAYFIGQELNMFNQDNQKTILSDKTRIIETITDVNTKPEIESVVPPENSILIDWGSDAMDRGNHDYDSLTHSDLVVDLDHSTIQRGDVIYYKTPEIAIKQNPNLPENYIARAVGLPGETVEIINGQVFIDDKKLDTFYSKATVRGMEEEEYFVKSNPANRASDEFWKEYFATNMEPVKVSENTIFVLVDHWWRGTDSRDFGVLPFDRVEGKVLGYQK